MSIPGFGSEAQMVRRGSRLVRAAARDNNVRIRTRYEVEAPGAVPDLVIFAHDGRQVCYVVAVEFKLRDWRRGLRQAFRHRNYVNEAHVVLDGARAMAAIEHIDLFKRANVGLTTLDRTGKVDVRYLPTPALPFSGRYAQSLAKKLVARSNAEIDNLPFIRSVRRGAALSPLRNIGGSM